MDEDEADGHIAAMWEMTITYSTDFFGISNTKAYFELN
jgi:hypothetical protein